MGRKRRRESRLDSFLAESLGNQRSLSTQGVVAKRTVTRSHRLEKHVMLVAFLLIIAVSGFTVAVWPSQTLHSLIQMSQDTRKAALLDSLSLTDPDPSFIWNVTRTLHNSGYTVDYYGPHQVTVALFRSLPFHDYRIVIIRSHTAIFYGIPTSVSIVTSENYTESRYVYEQLVGQVAPAIVRPGNTYFAITPSFVRDAMQGNFRGTILVEMGCSSLQGDHYIATAFVSKGVSNFVGWDNAVGSRYTDGATQNFVSSLAGGKTLEEAIGSAGGPDPTYHGRLSYLDTALSGREQFGSPLITFSVFAILLSVTLLVTRRVIGGTRSRLRFPLGKHRISR
ncbi:MAG TPA: hypothetical protein VNW25_00235 [Candidatus Sulfotelmatobacter sp.]|nr:hypothetical protein [Candidatus Sulfotelmatobacter sp.]